MEPKNECLENDFPSLNWVIFLVPCLQGAQKIPPEEKENHRLKSAFLWDMLVPRRVTDQSVCSFLFGDANSIRNSFNYSDAEGGTPSLFKKKRRTEMVVRYWCLIDEASK